jgi:hypothetical protein
MPSGIDEPVVVVTLEPKDDGELKFKLLKEVVPVPTKLLPLEAKLEVKAYEALIALVAFKV